MLTNVTASIAIVVSIAALVVSIYNIYWVHMRVDHSLSVSSYNINKRNSKYHADLVISNTGNRALAVADLHFGLFNANFTKFEVSYVYVETDINGIDSPLTLSNTQLTLKPGDIIVVRLSSAFDFSERNSPIRNSYYNIGIAFTVFTSEAEETTRGIMPFGTNFDSNGLPEYPTRGKQFNSEHRKSWKL